MRILRGTLLNTYIKFKCQLNQKYQTFEHGRAWSRVSRGSQGRRISVSVICRWCGSVGFIRPGAPALTEAVCSRVWSGLDESQHLQVWSSGLGVSYCPHFWGQNGAWDGQADWCSGSSSAGVYRTVVIKRELSQKGKLLIDQSIYVLTLTYGHELWVVTKRMKSWIQAAEMRFLRRVAGLSLRDTVRSSDM